MMNGGGKLDLQDGGFLLTYFQVSLSPHLAYLNKIRVQPLK